MATGPDGEGCEEVTTKMFITTDMPVTEEFCGDSTHGCCPDGETTATGPDFEGCDVIIYEDCRESYFQCCPDGRTPGNTKI